MRLTTISFHNSCCKKSWGPVWFCHIAHEYLYNSTSVICKGWHTIFLSKRAKSEWLCYLVTFGNLRRTLGTFDIVRKSPEVFRSSWPRVDSVVTFLSVERLTKSFMWRNQSKLGEFALMLLEKCLSTPSSVYVHDSLWRRIIMAT